MKNLILILTALFFSVIIYAQVNPNHTYVNGYYRSNGTFVKGHYRTKPNTTNHDNYTTSPNVNPWTGKKGYVKPDNGYNPYSRSRSSSRTNTYYDKPFGSTSYNNPQHGTNGRKKSTSYTWGF